MRIKRTLRSIVAAIFSLSNVVSCTTDVSPPTVVHITEKQRAAFGRIGVISINVPPEEVFSTPIVGRGAGAARGAGAGAAQGAGEAVGALARSSCSGMGCGLTILLIPVFAVGGAIIGGIAGAANAVPTDTATAIEESITTALRDSQPQETLRSLVASTARKEGFNAEIVGGDPFPSTEEKTAYRKPLEEKQVDTLLEVGVTKVGLAGAGGSNPALILVAEASIRLINVENGRVLFERKTYQRYGSRRTFTEWGDNDGEVLKMELLDVYRRLAEKIVEVTFLEYH